MDFGKYKILYIWRPLENDNYIPKHKDRLKIGDATLHATKPISEYSEDELKEIAFKERIKDYSNTPGISVEVLYARVSITADGKEFRDKEVHKALERVGLSRVIPEGTTAQEWFDVDLHLAKAAIQSVIDGDNQILLETLRKSSDENLPKFKPRVEQEDAVNQTLQKWKKTLRNLSKGKEVSGKFLWNAKPRFGKTAAAYYFIKKSQDFKINEISQAITKVLIISHRPVVNDAWAKDVSFVLGDEYSYEARDTIKGTVVNEWFDKFSKEKVLRFTSVQALREKDANDNWTKTTLKILEDSEKAPYDLLIIDEAHEGIDTDLARDIIDKIKRKFTLHLSGTPYKQLSNQKFDPDEIYTWDYIDEQKAKEEWTLNHPGEYNPYSLLPFINIKTIDVFQTTTDKEKLGELTEDSSFDFGKFFKTIDKSGNVVDDSEDVIDFNMDEQEVFEKKKSKIDYSNVKFADEDRVYKFLDRISSSEQTSDECEYMPFSNKTWKYNRHSLWVMSSVSAAKSMKKLLDNHPAFRGFEIIDATGDEGVDSLEKILKATEGTKDNLKDPWNTSSITLTYGRLTLGVSVPAWSTVLVLRKISSPALYMQTIFRAQTPCEKFEKLDEGKILPKTEARIYDFAPDQALQMIAEAVSSTTRKQNKTITDTGEEVETSEEEQIQDWLNYCPVLAFDGNRMKSYNAFEMMEKVKEQYSRRVVENGFADKKLLNKEAMLNLTNEDLELFKDLEKFDKTVKFSKDTLLPINESGLEGKPYKDLKDSIKKNKEDKVDGKKIPQTDDEKELDRRKRRANEVSKQMETITVRIPLMILGARIEQKWNIIDNFDIAKFVDLFSDEDWKEFMLKISKDEFLKYVKFFDKAVMRGSLKEWLKRVDDSLSKPMGERIDAISKLLGFLHSPDKETIITPRHVAKLVIDKAGIDWRDASDNETTFYEINSKTGIFPLMELNNLIKENFVIDGDGLIPKPSKIHESYKENLERINAFENVLKANEEASIELTNEKYGLIIENENYVDLIGEKLRKIHGTDKMSNQTVWQKLIKDHIFANARTKSGLYITLRVLGVERNSIEARNFTAIDVISLRKIFKNYNELKSRSKKNLEKLSPGELTENDFRPENWVKIENIEEIIGKILKWSNVGFIDRIVEKNSYDHPSFVKLSKEIHEIVESFIDKVLESEISSSKIREIVEILNNGEDFDKIMMDRLNNMNSLENAKKLLKKVDEAKFGWVISNPPYSVSDQSRSYKIFADISMKLSEEDVIFISPTSMKNFPSMDSKIKEMVHTPRESTGFPIDTSIFILNENYNSNKVKVDGEFIEFMSIKERKIQMDERKLIMAERFGVTGNIKRIVDFYIKIDEFDKDYHGIYYDAFSILKEFDDTYSFVRLSAKDNRYLVDSWFDLKNSNNEQQLYAILNKKLLSKEHFKNLKGFIENCAFYCQRIQYGTSDYMGLLREGLILPNLSDYRISDLEFIKGLINDLDVSDYGE